ncbi:g10457 [Coccomyxa elongata]
MADLHIRSTSLAAENEALRGHVQHLQDKIARFEDTITAQELAAADSADLEVAQLHAELERQRSLLREVSSAAHDLESENESLDFEVAGLRDAKRQVDLELTTLKERTKTLQELYLRATRTGQGTPAACNADMRLDEVDDIIRSAMPPCNADACPSDEDFAEPGSIVPALQQIASLRRERDVLRAQVDKTEGALEQALREKQDLRHALATEKRRASGKSSQARLINLARRVQILAEQVRQKDGALSEKAAYVAKLEWRLLCQQKALEARQKPPLPYPRVPAADRALHRKPHLPGTDLATSRIPLVDPPKQPAVDAVHRSHVEGREAKQPDRVAGEPADVAAKYGGFATSSEVHEDVGSNMHGSNAPAALQHEGIGPRASRSSKPSARKSLFSTPEPARNGQQSSSPRHRRENPMPTPQQAPTPTYISRSQQQESGLSAGVVDSRPAAVQASPALSEMVYELRPAALHAQRHHVPRQANPEGHGGSNASLLPPDSAAAVSQWEHGEVDMPHGQTVASSDRPAWDHEMVPGPTMAHQEIATSGVCLSSWHDRGSSGAEAVAGAGQWGSPEGVASSLPNYSGFSSEMRAAAQATAAALLADASWPGESAAPHEQLSTSKQLTLAGDERNEYPGQGEANWGSEAAEAFQGLVSQDRGGEHFLTVEELEEQIRAFNLMLEADEGGVLLEQV